MYQDISSLKKSFAKILNNESSLREFFNSATDSVTGYENFSYFRITADRLIENSNNDTLSVWYSDIKNFKFINDAYGYDIGDKILKFWADWLNSSCSKILFSRVSGDKFVAIIPNSDKPSCNDLHSKMVSALKDYAKSILCHAPIELATGIYISKPQRHQKSINLMIDKANIAQKSKKTIGGSTVCFYTESLRQKQIYELSIIQNLLSSISNKNLYVVFQPQYDCSSGKMAGCEALVRWNHPLYGNISPADFIPILEKNNKIFELDMFTLRSVCEYIKSLKEAKSVKKIVPISVNISRINVYRENICDNILDTVKTYELSPSDISLEITESAYSENSKQLISVVKRLDEMGFSVQMDDFGTGYSSLNILKDVPVDVIKLDMKFISESENNERGREIINCITDMAHCLNMSVIAEGIETKKQSDFLYSVGCKYMQGYHFCKPISASELNKLLKSSDNICNNNEFITSRLSIEKLANNVYELSNRIPYTVVFDYNTITDTLVYQKTDSNSLVSSIIINNFKSSFCNAINIHPTNLETLASRFKICLHNETSGSFICRMNNFNTGYRWNKLFYKSMAEENGKIHRIVGRIDDIDDEKRRQTDRENHLLYNANHDAMTGLLNRLAVENKVNQYLDLNVFCAMIAFDVDNFKLINDSFGHLFGDTILREVTEKIQGFLDSQDLFARIGGDEFLIFLPDIIDKDSVIKRMDAITGLISSIHLNEKNSVSCSFGIAFSENTDKRFDDIFLRADAALYNVKRNGKGNYTVYSNSIEVTNENKDNYIKDEMTDSQDCFMIARDVFTILYNYDNIYKSIDYALSYIGRSINSDRISVFKLENDGMIRQVNEWVCNKKNTKIDRSEKIEFNSIMLPEISKPIIIDLSNSEKWHKLFISNSACSSAVIAPVMSGKNISGYLVSEDYESINRSESQINMLDTVAKLIANYI